MNILETVFGFITEHETLFTFIATFSVTIIYYRFRLLHARLINLSSIVQIERSLGSIETNAFRFHGITEGDMERAGVTKEELAYLVANFTAGRIYDVGVYHMFTTYKSNNYRYKMLSQPETRRAWPLIVKMMTVDKYILKLQRTKDRIENLAIRR